MQHGYAYQSLRQGLIVGVVLAFVGLIGALTAFAAQPVVAGTLSLTQIILLAGGLAAGHLAQGKLPMARRSPRALSAYGVLAGALGMLLPALMAFLIQAVDMRRVLVNAVPELVAALSLGLGLPLGAVVLVAAGAVLGAAGALLSVVPSPWRRVVITSVATVLALGIVRDKGMPSVLALALLLVVGALAWGYVTYGPRLRGEYRRARAERSELTSGVTIGTGLAVLIVLPHILGIYGTSVLDLVGLYAMMGLGLNIVVGYAGLLDLGYVAFFLIGAYVTGILTSPAAAAKIGMSFWMAWPLALLAAAFAGTLLGVPVLRMRGDYLAIVTLGFGEITRILILSDALKGVSGGAQGVIEIPSPNILGFEFIKPQHFYYLFLLGCVAAVIVSLRLADSRIGRAWMAMREDEDVAEATGINLARHKLLAFGLGASFAGIGGAVFASWLHAAFPNSFTLLVSINILSLIIVGGMGSVPGVILGALVLVGLPEVLREFADFRMISFGALLVIMMLARPEGLWPAQRRRRELEVREA